MVGLMSEHDPTCIGRVRHVLGATITVALDPDLAGVAPIYRGRLQAVGQIGSLIRIPQGLVDLIATVSLVGFNLGTPALVDSGDPSSVELGVKFSSSVKSTGVQDGSSVAWVATPALMTRFILQRRTNSGRYFRARMKSTCAWAGWPPQKKCRCVWTHPASSFVMRQ